MIKYYINTSLGAITGFEGFSDASAAELRVLLALIEAGGAVNDEATLADLALTTKSRAVSALALWEEAGVISQNTTECAEVSDEFGVCGKVSRSSDVARTLRDSALAEAISECSVIFGLGPLSSEAAKDIHYLYIDLGLSCEYIVALASYVYEKKKDTVRQHSNIMNYYTARMKSDAKRLTARGIDTLEDLEIEFKRNSEERAAVIRFREATGFYGNLGPSMIKAITKWFNEYCYSEVMVARAYDIATQRSRDGQWYKLTARIIDNWYKEGCKTVADCEANEKLHAEKKKSKVGSKEKATSTPKYGNFNSEDALMAALMRSYGDGKED